MANSTNREAPASRVSAGRGVVTAKITLAMLREEAARVFGAEVLSDVYDHDSDGLRGFGPSQSWT